MAHKYLLCEDNINFLINLLVKEYPNINKENLYDKIKFKILNTHVEESNDILKNVSIINQKIFNEMKKIIEESNKLDDILKVLMKHNNLINFANAIKKINEISEKKTNNIEFERILSGKEMIEYVLSKKEKENINDLNLEIDPKNNPNDQKNIIIDIKTEKKITKITLISYYLPENKNIINNFNCNIAVLILGEMININLEHGIYDMNEILTKLKLLIPKLNFTMNNNRVTISSEDIFEFFFNDNSIFSLLGFTKNKYEKAKKYKAEKIINIETPKCFFQLASTPMEPLEMTLNENIECNKILRQINQGINTKKLILKFTSNYGYYYDFIDIFKIRLHIDYL